MYRKLKIQKKLTEREMLEAYNKSYETIIKVTKLMKIHYF